MINEAHAFQDAVKSETSLAWKMLERLFARGERSRMRELIEIAPPEFFEKSSENRKEFLGRIIKAGDVEDVLAIITKTSNPSSFKKEIIENLFGNICETKDPAMIDVFYPPNEKTKSDHQQWTMAVLRKNMTLLERMEFSVQPKRALNFIENYFYDLQLAQLKHLEQYIPVDKWPMRFAVDALNRGKGPGVINFFIDHAIKNKELAPEDVWDCTYEAVEHSNVKVFERIKGIIEKQFSNFDWDTKGPLRDFSIKNLGPEKQELRISVSKVPAELQQVSLIELSIIKGDVELAQLLAETSSKDLPNDKMEQWIAQIKKFAAEKKELVQYAVIHLQSTNDIIRLQHGANPTPQRKTSPSQPMTSK